MLGNTTFCRELLPHNRNGYIMAYPWSTAVIVTTSAMGCSKQHESFRSISIRRYRLVFLNLPKNKRQYARTVRFPTSAPYYADCLFRYGFRAITCPRAFLLCTSFYFISPVHTHNAYVFMNNNNNTRPHVHCVCI